jgi:TRAP-type mannitol/chloroaromatic compound transport system substrate-binding protein
VIDASEWIGPHDDMKLGPHTTARSYYYPGGHEPGTVTEFGFNKKAYEALPVDLRCVLDYATATVQVIGLTEFHTKNSVALGRLRTEFQREVTVISRLPTALRCDGVES